MSTVFLAGGEFEGSSIVADAITQVSPKHTSTITSHPVETGVNVSDHIYKNNVIIDILGEFSSGFVEKTQQNIVGYTNKSRDQEAWGVLYKIWSEESPLTIVSRFQVYENCYITALIPLDETDTGETLRFSMTLEQVRFATLEERDSTAIVRAGNLDQTSAKKNGGVKTTKDDKSSRLVEVFKRQFSGEEG